jgi:hypothetical protein
LHRGQADRRELFVAAKHLSRVNLIVKLLWMG